MSYRNQMIDEITNQLTSLSERKKNWDSKFIAKSIIDSHSDEWVSNESIFLEYNLYENVKRLVTQVISKLAADKPEVEKLQLVMPGFECLQVHYMIDGIGVHIDNMTDEQIDDKTKFYRSMGQSCFRHADELQSYKTKRSYE